MMKPTESQPLPDELLSVAALAKRLHVADSTVRRWVKDGSIPYLTVGERIRFDPAEVAEWAKRHRRAA